jgi:hypothetical protein
MTLLSRELNKQGWDCAGHDSDHSSSDMVSPEIARNDPTPSQGLQKRNGQVARRLQFGGNDSEEEEIDTGSELDEPPVKQTVKRVYAADKIYADSATRRSKSSHK